MPVSLNYDDTDNVGMQPGEDPGNADWMAPFRKIHQEDKKRALNFTAMRTRAGARTVYKGGWGNAADSSFNDAGIVRRHVRETWNPRSWMRMPSQEVFNPAKRGFTNPWFKESDNLASQERTRSGKWLEKTFGKEGGVGERMGMFEDSRLQHAFDPGMMQRYSAAADVFKMEKVNIEHASNISKMLDISGNPEMAKTVADLSASGGLTGETASQAIRMSYRGAISGRVAGFVEGASGRILDEGLKAGMSQAVTSGFTRGATAAATKQSVKDVGWRATMEAKQAGYDAAKPALEGVGEEVATKIGAKAAAGTIFETVAATGAETAAAAGEGGLNPVMDALAIYGWVKLGLTAANIGFKVASDIGGSALKSFRGQIGKDPFGMGYRDTAAAATARSRGVMAIQNSRLNARSLLGNEAAMMHAHFG